jgi:hypothetical protein
MRTALDAERSLASTLFVGSGEMADGPDLEGVSPSGHNANLADEVALVSVALRGARRIRSFDHPLAHDDRAG